MKTKLGNKLNDLQKFIRYKAPIYMGIMRYTLYDGDNNIILYG